jgi:hypothetical protein
MAVGARLAAELGWIEEVRKLMEKSLTDAHERTEALQVCVAL